MSGTPAYLIDPHDLLNDVHPDLGRIMRAVVQGPNPQENGFIITYGARTLAAEALAVAEGHSQTLHSRHLPQAGEHGLACAVDITCFVNGVAIEEGPEVEPVYTAASILILAAAAKLGIPLEWGGAKVGAWVPGVVSGFRDWGHYQLPWAQYP